MPSPPLSPYKTSSSLWAPILSQSPQLPPPPVTPQPSLTSSLQHKNVIKGDSIRHGATGYPCACEVVTIRRHVAHLQQNGAPINAQIVTVFKGKQRSTVYIVEISAALCNTTNIIGPQVGFTTEDISARSMWAGRAIDILMNRVNTDTIHIVGRWHSGAMLR